MKKAPCARFGIRIRPKISENPDDSRNSRPPNATLLSVWMIQNCHCIPESWLQILCRRVVARIDRIFQELILAVGPELAHVGIGLDDRIDVFSVLFLDLADV